MPLKKIISFKPIPENFIPARFKFRFLLRKSLITIISGPTSAILESYFKSNILILPNIEIGTKINAQRLKIDKNKFFVINNEKELLKEIKFIKKNKLRLLNKKTKNYSFFEELNKKNIKIFN